MNPLTSPSPTSLADTIDRVCDAFERAWHEGRRPLLEEYLGSTEEPLRSKLWTELVLSELACRRASGETPALEQYLQRFPDRREQLERLWTDNGTVSLTEAPGRTAPRAEEWAEPQISGYELLEEIARGGMGLVFKARQVALNRVVALKMIQGGQLASTDEVQRFRLEAEAAASLDHPNIVPIYEVGSHQRQHYLAMKLMEGGNLAEYLARHEPDSQTAARLVEAAARAVHHAHQHGILHRDLKPANILLDAQGEPHVTDFGLAKRLEDSAGLTQTGAIVGTPSYMAPEQAAGTSKGLTTAADVYSLGAILYELLTGRPPFRGETVLETLQQVRFDEPASPRRLRPMVPRDLETICLKCLHKEPANRYPSAEALADDLRRFLDGRSIAARPLGPLERGWRWCRRNPWIAALIAAVLLVSSAGTIVATLFAFDARDKRRQADDNAGDARKKQAEATAEKERVRRLLYDSKMNLAQHAFQANRPRQLAELLAQTCPAAGEDDLRGFEWRYLSRASGGDLPGFAFPNTIIGDAWGSRPRFSHDGKWFGFLTERGDPHTKVTPEPGPPVGEIELSIRDSTSGAVLFSHKVRQDLGGNHDWTFSSDARRVIRGAEQSLQVLDFDTGRVLDTLTLEHRLWFFGADRAFRRLAVVVNPNPNRYELRGSRLEVWDLEKRRRIYSLPTAEGFRDRCFVFSPDGRFLARQTLGGRPTGKPEAGEPVLLEVFDAASGRRLWGLNDEYLPQGPYTPDSKQLLTVRDKALTFWDAETGAKVQTVGDLPEPPAAGGLSTGYPPVSISPDGVSLAVGHRSGQVNVHDLREPTRLRTFRRHEASVVMLAWRDKETLISLDNNCWVRTFDTARREHRRFETSRQPVPPVGGWKHGVFDRNYTRLARLTSSNSRHRWKAMVFDQATGAVLIEREGDLKRTVNRGGTDCAVALSPDGSRLAVAVIEAAGLPVPQTLARALGTPIEGLGGLVRSVVLCEQLMPWTLRVQVWDVATGRELFATRRECACPEFPLTEAQRFEFSENGRFLLLSSLRNDATDEYEFRYRSASAWCVWDLERGTVVRTVKAEAFHRHFPVFSDGGRCLTVVRAEEAPWVHGSDPAFNQPFRSASVTRWDLAAGTEEFSRPLPLTAVPARSVVTISPAGRHLVALWAGRNFKTEVRVWDIGSPVGKPALLDAAAGFRGVTVHALPGEGFDRQTLTAVFDAGERRMAVPVAGGIAVWDLEAGGEPLLLRGINGPVLALGLAGDRLAALCQPRAPWGSHPTTLEVNDLKLWNLATGQEVLSVPHGGNHHSQLFFDGARLRLFDHDNMGTTLRILDGSP